MSGWRGKTLGMSLLIKVVVWVVCVSVGLLLVAVLLLFLEASGGHDGWLCEWGIDRDGAGTRYSSCG